MPLGFSLLGKRFPYLAASWEWGKGLASAGLKVMSFARIRKALNRAL
jgi:hypothetical protein